MLMPIINDLVRLLWYAPPEPPDFCFRPIKRFRSGQNYNRWVYPVKHRCGLDCVFWRGRFGVDVVGSGLFDQAFVCRNT